METSSGPLTMPSERWVCLYRDGPDTDLYLFVSRLGEGHECAADLVYYLPSHSLRVRRVDKRSLTKAMPVDSSQPDVDIPKSLSDAAFDRSLSPKLLAPLSDHRVPFKLPGISGHARVSYWPLCDGGSLAQLAKAFRLRSLDMPPILLAKCMLDVLRTLQWLYHVVSPPIIHGDLHWANILVHWGTEQVPEFVLGDFECSGVPTWEFMEDQHMKPSGDIDDVSLIKVFDLVWTRLDPECLVVINKRLRQLRAVVAGLADEFDFYKPEEAYEDELAELPDLSEAIGLARGIYDDLLADLRVSPRQGLEDVIVGRQNQQPVCKATKRELLAACRSLRVAGPWYAALVSGSLEDGSFKVESVDSEMHA